MKRDSSEHHALVYWALSRQCAAGNWSAHARERAERLLFSPHEPVRLRAASLLLRCS
jgi:hypothetical protein